MADVKVSALPPDTTPQNTDYFVIVDRTTNTTKYVQVQYLSTIFAALTSAQALTNTFVQKRVTSVVSIATATPNVGTTDMYIITAQAENLAFANPVGTPTEGQVLLVRIKDNGTVFNISYTAAFRGVGVTLPTTTLGSSKVLYLGFVYNGQDAVWDLLAAGRQA